jgi:tetratricopeptide (TPR) repeat protein
MGIELLPRSEVHGFCSLFDDTVPFEYLLSAKNKNIVMIESKINKDLERQIDLYINGRLNEKEIDELWTELIQDEYYLDYTKSVANLKAIIEENRADEVSAPTLKLRKYINYGAAAAIALVIGVVGVLNYNMSNSVPSDLAPIGWIELDTNRGEPETPTVSDNEVVKQAIRLANDGNTETAIQILEDELNVVTEAIDIAEIALTLGSIQYNYGDYALALENFKVVTSQEGITKDVLERGYWYLGNTYFQLNNLIEAEKAFEQTLELDGNYSRVVERYLDVFNTVED